MIRSWRADHLALKLTPGPDMALTLTRGMTQDFASPGVSVPAPSLLGFVQIPPDRPWPGRYFFWRNRPRVVSGREAGEALPTGLPGRARDPPQPQSARTGRRLWRRGKAARSSSRGFMHGSAQSARSSVFRSPSCRNSRIRRKAPSGCRCSFGVFLRSLRLCSGATYAFGAA